MTEIMPPGYVKPLQRISYKGQGKSKTVRDTMHKRGYDPLHAMIDLYERLTAEDAFWCAIRDGSLVKLSEAGPKIRYSSMTHQAVLGQINKVHADLLKYGYHPVVAEENDVGARSSMVIEIQGEVVREINPDES